MQLLQCPYLVPDVDKHRAGERCGEGALGERQRQRVADHGRQRRITHGASALVERVAGDVERDHHAGGSHSGGGGDTEEAGAGSDVQHAVPARHVGAVDDALRQVRQ